MRGLAFGRDAAANAEQLELLDRFALGNLTAQPRLSAHSRLSSFGVGEDGRQGCELETLDVIGRELVPQRFDAPLQAVEKTPAMASTSVATIESGTQVLRAKHETPAKLPDGRAHAAGACVATAALRSGAAIRRRALARVAPPRSPPLTHDALGGDAVCGTADSCENARRGPHSRRRGFAVDIGARTTVRARDTQP